jgi:hypothetical protein
VKDQPLPHQGVLLVEIEQSRWRGSQLIQRGGSFQAQQGYVLSWQYFRVRCQELSEIKALQSSPLKFFHTSIAATTFINGARETQTIRYNSAPCHYDKPNQTMQSFASER